jgi:hypothetical protein
MTELESGKNNKYGVESGGRLINSIIAGKKDHHRKEMSSGKGVGGAGRNPVALTELATLMADFAADREWDQFHSPRNLLLALVRFFFLPLLCLLEFLAIGTDF